MKSCDKLQLLKFKRRWYRTTDWEERSILCSYEQQRVFFSDEKRIDALTHATEDDIYYLLNTTVNQPEPSDLGLW
jgi:hypothetical protein